MDENAGIGVAAESGDSAATSEIPRFCRWCGARSKDAAQFCGECGKPLQDAHDTREYAPVGGEGESPSVPPPQPGDGPTMAPPPQYVTPYPYPPGPPESSSNTGLLIGLIAAVIAALGAVAAVVILASGDSGKGPSLSTATNVAASTVATTSQATNSTPALKRHKHRGSGGLSLLISPSPRTTPSPPPPPSASPADAAAARDTVVSHWTLIGEGNYEAAFALFVQGYQSHDTWIADKNRDRPAVSNLVVGSADMHSATSATVPLVSLHTVGLEAPQCHNWTGSYDLTKVNGKWLISQANLSGSTC